MDQEWWPGDCHVLIGKTDQCPSWQPKWGRLKHVQTISRAGNGQGEVLGRQPAGPGTHSSLGRLIRGHVSAGGKKITVFVQHLSLGKKIRGEQVCKEIIFISRPALGALRVEFHTSTCREVAAFHSSELRPHPRPSQVAHCESALHTVKERIQNEDQD